MEARTLDRPVTIERPVLGRDAATGAQTVTWETFAAGVWASKENFTNTGAGEEYLRDGVQVHGEISRVRIRWLPDVDTTMRLDMGGGRLLRIIGRAELGRGEGWELTCREWSHD